MSGVKPGDKITMNTTATGPDGNHYAGQTYVVERHVSLKDAVAYLKGGYAALVKEAKAVMGKVETAEAPQGENAAEIDSKPGKPGKK